MNKPLLAGRKISPTPVLRYSEEPNTSPQDLALRSTSEPASSAIAWILKSLRSSIILVLGLGGASVSVAENAPTPGSYHVAATYPIGGEGRWDYVAVDPAAGLLYVTRQTHVQIIKENGGEVIADIPNTPGCHGVALVPERSRGFVSNGQGNSVTLFDLKTNKALAVIPAGKKPDAIIYDPATKKVLSFNGNSKDVTVIDAAVDPAKPVADGTIALEGKPEFAAADGQGHVYVNLEDKNSIAAIDVKGMKVTAVWKLEGADEPSGLAIDIAHHRLFAGCGNEVMAIVDTETGKTLATLPIGKGVDACAFDPGAGHAFASCGDGTLTVIKETSAGKFAVVQTVKTRAGARTMGLDATTHTIYLPTAEMEKAAEGSKRPSPKTGTFMIVVVAPGGK